MSHFLRSERERVDLKQKTIYEYCKVDRKTYSRWEAGTPIPSNKLTLLAELGFDVLYVITGTRSVGLPVQNAGRLNHEEEVLLDNYRHCSPKEQAAIKATSDALAQQYISKKLTG